MTYNHMKKSTFFIENLHICSSFAGISNCRQRNEQEKLEWVVSRILYPAMQVMIIYLGCRSPGISSNLPGNIGRAALKRFPI